MGSNYSKINKAHKQSKSDKKGVEQTSAYGKGKQLMAKVIIIGLGVLMVITFSATSIMMALGQ